ncbi:MAG TPA: biopolymer transporter ExbD [Polyangiaceae bacterium]|jgi:biopolymer transport protein ExbD
MAGDTRRAPSSAITGINVTPLVDITLVLLIIFMVTAKLIVSPKAMNIEPPKAMSGKDVQEIFSIVLFADGKTQANGRWLPSDDAALEIAQGEASKYADLRAVIKADNAVPHGRVMHVLDLLRRAGLTKIGFGVVPTDATPARALGPQ